LVSYRIDVDIVFQKQTKIIKKNEIRKQNTQGAKIQNKKIKDQNIIK
jgi:hypothetical protein